MHGFLNFQLEACARRVEDSKTIFWTEGATILRTSQVLKDVGMFSRGEMFTDANGEVSIGFTFTNITDTAACTEENWLEN